jgi:sugar lactone lactonase YvrE
MLLRHELVRMSRAEIWFQNRHLLAESPLWCAAERALFWVDIGTRALYRSSAGDAAPRSWQLPDYPGGIAEVAAGVVAVAMGEGVHLLDLNSGATHSLASAPHMKPGVRFNDGRVDPRGRFWAGTMQNNFGPSGESIPIERHDGALYRFDGNGDCRLIDSDVGIANTLAWSPDASLLYFADSLRGQIFLFDFDLDTGEARDKRLFFEMPGHGVPDGSAIDADGCLWNARYGAGAVVRITSRGAVDRIVQLPVPLVTSCTFGGRALETLYITSASSGLSEAEFKKAPLSGSVFALEGAGCGMPVARFALSGRSSSLLATVATSSQEPGG